MKIPIIADCGKVVASTYGVLTEDRDQIPLRALFIIDPTGNLRQITVNDLPVGRSVDEVLRLIQAFQFVAEHGEVCPANWKPGAMTMTADPIKSMDYFSSAHK
jgi:alkyl hydroperoxide reductase subunit AhpC